ncbi:hypothetical protein F5I97DRAFT_1931336 [Phlebopus sp. FC_14]|nr:hypothetical protein F5I97DRAFT_1931336 [Phlebopus sp. FC_14]
MSSNPGPIQVPSTLSCLFSTNFCPTQVQFVGAKSLIEKQKCQLSTLEHEVARLQKQLADMEQRHASAEELLTNLKAVLAPIKRIPPEILSEIFEHCLPPNEPYDPFCFPRPRQTQAPSLSRQVLQTWIELSGALPLNLVVAIQTDRVFPALVHMFDIIAANAHRWNTVHLRIQNAPRIFTLISRAFTNCSSLSVFDITDGGRYPSSLHADEEMGSHTSPLAFHLQDAPLRQLALSLAGLTISQVHAPWPSLSRLTFMHHAHASSSSVTDYLAVLQQCTSLRECHLTIDGGVRDAALQPITIPRLESLHVQVLRNASTTTQLGDLLSAIEAPCLSSLVIKDNCPRRDPMLYLTQLKTFLEVHSQTMRDLKVSTNSTLFTADDLVSLVSVTPLLTDLEFVLDDEVSPLPIVEALTPRTSGDENDGTGSCLLPSLERFIMYWDTSKTVSKVAEMVERRYAASARRNDDASLGGTTPTITRLKYLSCRPARIGGSYDYMPEHFMVQGLDQRLEEICREGLVLDWQLFRFDAQFWF